MKRKLLSTICLLMAGILFCNSMSVFATEKNAKEGAESTAEATKDSLGNIKKAQAALSEILKEETVFALVYLCESYELKQNADAEGATVRSLATGTTVEIEDVLTDKSGNVWYKISGVDGTDTYSGYIQKDYLACSNEVFMTWEQEYFSGYGAGADSLNSVSSVKGSSKSALSYADVEQFPESYQDALMALKRKHPNWIFVKQNTNIKWQKAVAGESYKDRSLVSSSMPSAYKDGEYGDGWHYASDEAIAYYMDPRNFLDDTRIFQFEQLTFNHSYHTAKAVQTILSGTFMSGDIPNEDMTYAKAFYEIGASLGVSPFHLASRVYQEQGTGKSALISGKYDGYEGLYNYFNIGASGKTEKEIIVSGLAYAKNKGWNTRYKSLKGGAGILSVNYILKGQDTIYLQKFNVDGRYYSLYTHQYMQNIRAPYTESVKIKRAYANAGALENSFVFKIPVYKDMPEKACPIPGTVITPKPTQTPKPAATPTAKPTAAPTATKKPATTSKPVTEIAPVEGETATPKPPTEMVPVEGGTATPNPTVAPTKKPAATPTATKKPAETKAPESTETPTPVKGELELVPVE